MKDKLTQLNVTQKCVDNTLYILNGIQDLIIIDFDNLYSTNYGTVVMQFNLNNHFIEIEVGKSEVGYFIEKGNKDIVLRQNKLDISLLNILINDLKSIMN